MTTPRRQYQPIREPNVMVPMRDGVRLATDVVRPDAPGRFPVLINRGPYGKDSYLDNPDHSIWFFPRHGYVQLDLVLDHARRIAGVKEVVSHVRVESG